MAKIVTIGSICQDIFFPTREAVFLETPEDVLSQKKLAFELGAKYPIEERHESLGGNSANVAVGLSKLGEDVITYTTVGDDMTGKWILKELEKTGIKKDAVKIENNCASDLSAIIVDENQRDRIIFSSHVANKKLIFEERRMGNPQWIFIGDLSGDWQKITDEIISFAKQKNILLAFNPRQKTIHDDVGKILETIKHSEIIFLNKDEAMEIVSQSEHAAVRELLENEEYLVKSLHRIGSAIAIVTDGERGAWGYNSKEIVHVEADLHFAKDTTGAGDAFTSGFFAAHLKGLSLKNSLQWGIVNSGNAVTEYGGQKGLLRESEIIERLGQIQIKK